MKANRENPAGAYGTHVHPLLVAAFNTEGTIIEMGAGDFSTPLLHELCKAQNRELITYENNKEWLENFADLESDTHKVQYVEDWDEVPVQECGLILIDHAPAERRHVDVLRFKDDAQIILCHDTENYAHYQYYRAFPIFEFKHIYKRYIKTSTLLSKYVDVSKLFEV